MIVKLLTEHHLEFLSLKGGCRGSSESTLVKMSNCWKSHAAVHIRINLEFEGWIEKSVLRITVWHQKACRVMTNGDREGQIFLSHPHTNNGFVFLLSIKYCF